MGVEKRVLVLLVLILAGACLDKAPPDPEPRWKDVVVALGIGGAVFYSLQRLGDPKLVAATFGVLYFWSSQRLDDINPLPKVPEAEHQDLWVVLLFLLLYVCTSGLIELLARASRRTTAQA